TDDTYKKLIAQMQRQIEPLATFQKSFSGQSGAARLVEDMNRQRDLMRTAYGPMGELRKYGALAALTQQGGAIKQVYKAMEAVRNRFELPDVQSATKLLEEIENGPTSRLAAHFLGEKDIYKRAIDAIQTPWLDTANQLRSVG